MDIFVFIKQVPDTEARIRINKDGTGINTEDVTFMDSPYDEYAVEQAILLSESNPGTTVTAVTIGPERASSLLRDNLAKGINEAIHIKTDEYGEYDALTTARIIASFLKDKKYDLLLFGNKAYGSDNSLVPSMVAGILDIAQVNLVTNMEINGKMIKAERQVEGMTEVVEAAIPCLISAQKGLNQPRMKSLKGIMAAKKKEIPALIIDELGLSADSLKPGIKITGISSPPAKAEGRKIEAEPEQAASELYKYLKNEIKVI